MNILELKNEMKMNPDLTATGMDKEHSRSFVKEREALLTYLDACNASIEWLSLVKRSREPNKKIGNTYRLKHLVERWYEAEHGKPMYVPQGAFIAAAYYMGLVGVQKPGTAALYLNISSKSKINGKWI